VRTEGFARNLQKDTRLLYTFSFHPSVSGIQKQEQPKEQVNNTAVKELPVGMVYRCERFLALRQFCQLRFGYY